MIDNGIYKCGSYLRLSREDYKNGDESSSIEGQRLINNSFAKHNGFKIVREYSDDGFSGGNFDRPGFERMINDIETGKINCVITKDLARLGREMYGTGKYIEQYFIEHQVRYIAINDSYDSLIGDSMLGIRLSVNDLYLRDVSKKVRTSLHAKQEKGDYIGSFPCYGYKKDPNDHHHLIIDEEAAKIVRKIYDLFLGGFSMTKICHELTDAKIPIPIVYKKEPRGLMVTENDGYGVWKRATVCNILTSQMYIGNMVQHIYEKVSHTSKKLRRLAEKERIIVENTHEAIISKDDFTKVQEIIKNRSRETIPIDNERYLLSGLIICGNCGHTLGIRERENKKGVSRYTHCNLYQRKGKYSNCFPNRINYNLLEEDILNFLQRLGSIFMDKYDSSNLMEDTIYYYNRDIENLNKKKDDLNRELCKERKCISSLYNDRINETISIDTYKMLSQEHETKIKQLNKELNSVSDSLILYSNNSVEKEFYKCKRAIEQFMSLKTPTKDTIKRLIKRIVVSGEKEKEVKVFLKFKFLVDLAKEKVVA